MSSGWTVATRAWSWSPSGLCSGGRLMFGPWDLDALGLARIGRRDDVDVLDVGGQLGHWQQVGWLAVLAWVLDPAGQQRHRGDGRRAQYTEPRAFRSGPGNSG